MTLSHIRKLSTVQYAIILVALFFSICGSLFFLRSSRLFPTQFSSTASFHPSQPKRKLIQTISGQSLAPFLLTVQQETTCFSHTGMHCIHPLFTMDIRISTESGSQQIVNTTNLFFKTSLLSHDDTAYTAYFSDGSTAMSLHVVFFNTPSLADKKLFLTMIDYVTHTHAPKKRKSYGSAPEQSSAQDFWETRKK